MAIHACDFAVRLERGAISSLSTMSLRLWVFRPCTFANAVEARAKADHAYNNSDLWLSLVHKGVTGGEKKSTT